MDLLKKIGLFLSSFAPLFLLLIIKELIEILNENWTFNFLNTSVLIILFVFLIYGIISFYLILKQIKTFKTKEITIKNKKNITDDHFLGYFSLFVLFAVSFEIEMYSMACIFFIVLFFISIVYIKNDMYYINPLINILGFSFYDIEYTENQTNKTMRVFYKGRLQIGKKYLMLNKHSNFIFIIDKQ